ncbi:MAG: hypothetical protein CMQ41_07900 [Gammaproteobacteria bacterium]|nr:hypothetical protein [Gammaproteobacteria bacterium]
MLINIILFLLLLTVASMAIWIRIFTSKLNNYGIANARNTQKIRAIEEEFGRIVLERPSVIKGTIELSTVDGNSVILKAILTEEV